MIKITQAQNEALVKLMLFAEYQDKKISLIENEEFQKKLEELNWDSGIELDLFVMKETANVRKALETEDSRQTFLADQCSCFNTKETKDFCFQTIESVILSDGVEAMENIFLQGLKEYLKY